MEREINLDFTPAMEYFNTLPLWGWMLYAFGVCWLIGLFAIRRLNKGDVDEDGYMTAKDGSEEIGMQLLMVFVWVISPVWIPIYILYKMLTIGIVKGWKHNGK